MRKSRNPSLPWVIVFTSAALTLASATTRTRNAATRPLPARTKPASAEPECGPSCPRGDSRDKTFPGRRELWLRASAARDSGSGELRLRSSWQPAISTGVSFRF